jgi:hypothetical protein
MDTKTNIILGVVIALGLLVLGVFAYNNTVSFTKSCQEATATVTAITKSGDRYYTDIRFTTIDGLELNIRPWSSENQPGYGVGSKIAILYDTGNPLNVRKNDFFGIWGLSVVAFGMGLFILGSSVVYVIRKGLR